jgi:predicted transcriptional regulator
MAVPSSRRPTDSELQILRVLWDRGPSTVREVLENHPQPGHRYTTILKLMQIMADKEIVRRDESQRTHRYHAVASQQQMQKSLVKDLLARAFGGSAQQLVLHALDAAQSSPEELAEIQKLLDDKKRKENRR